MLKLPDKGSFGYFDKKKKINLTASVLSFLAVMIIYVTGILIYGNNKSIFTVIAAVSVLPAARILISYIIIAPYKSLSADRYEKLCLITGENDASRILCDILLTSEEKSMIAGTVVIYEGNILMFSENKKADPRAVENYMKKILETCNYSSVKMYTDYDQFQKKLQRCAAQQNQAEKDENSRQRLKTMCERIEHTIFLYTV